MHSNAIRIAAFAILALIAGFYPATANPTGAGLLVYPVEPCRVLDTRAGKGVIAVNVAIDVFVRGSQLRASDGAQRTDCRVPAAAEAVIVNVTAVWPEGNGFLKINGTGWVYGPQGQYSRLTYRAGENDANEMTVSLCNSYFAPHPHAACPQDGNGRYLDFQVLNPVGGAPVHLVVDVVAYLARP